MTNKIKNTDSAELRKDISLIKSASTKDDLQYDQLIYVLCKRRISIIKIAYFVRQKYNNLLPDWHQLPIETIIVDKNNLQTMHTERQWQFENISKNRFLAKKQLYQQYESKGIGQSKENIKNRIKFLRDQIIQCEGNMNIYKKQEEYLVQLGKYKELRDELKYWQQKKKREKDLSIQNSVINSPIKDKSRDNILLKLQSEIQQIKIKSHQKVPIIFQKISKRTLQQRLQRIFIYYANCNSKVSKFFNDIEKDLKKMSIQTYMKFIKDFQLNQVLSLEQIGKIYKKKTKSSKYIQFGDFCQTFEEIFKQECLKNHIDYLESQYEKYLIAEVVPSRKIQHFLKLKLQSLNSKSRQMTNRRYSNQRDSQSNENIKIHPKIGKQLPNESIKDNILKKLKDFKQKQAKQRLKKTKQDNRSSINEQGSDKDIAVKTIQSTIFEKNYNNSPSYIKSYQKKKKMLSQPILNKIQSKQINQPQKNEVSKDNVIQLDQLKEIIDQEEDQYLKIHLLPTIKNKDYLNNNMNRKVHF